jgi:hypothetical protein
MAVEHYLSPGLFFKFLIVYKLTGTLGREISPSQQQKRRITIHIHASSWIRPIDTSVWVDEDSLSLRQRNHCDKKN